MNLNSSYASGLLLVFLWQLMVLFYSPFFGATPRQSAPSFQTIGELTISSEQIAEDSATSNGYFIEEVLEEEYHTPEQFSYSLPEVYEFHFAFHLLIDYHQFNDLDLLPPEKKMI